MVYDVGTNFTVESYLPNTVLIPFRSNSIATESAYSSRIVDWYVWPIYILYNFIPEEAPAIDTELVLKVEIGAVHDFASSQGFI